jgi:hypothetical protein
VLFAGHFPSLRIEWVGWTGVGLFEWFKKHPEHPELASVLLDPNIKNYTQAVDAIAELRGIALAHLGNHLVSLFSRSTERKK